MCTAKCWSELNIPVQKCCWWMAPITKIYPRGKKKSQLTFWHFLTMAGKWIWQPTLTYLAWEGGEGGLHHADSTHSCYLPPPPKKFGSPACSWAAIAGIYYSSSHNYYSKQKHFPTRWLASIQVDIPSPPPRWKILKERRFDNPGLLNLLESWPTSPGKDSKRCLLRSLLHHSGAAQPMLL